MTTDDTEIGRNQIALRTRTFAGAVSTERRETERDSVEVHHSTKLTLRRTALILIDVWENHPNEGFRTRALENVRDRITPLIRVARRAGMTIVHAAHGYDIAAAALPADGEIELTERGWDTTEAFDTFLKERSITTLLYAGYASNWCVINRPVGLVPMRYEGYEVVLLRDCTLAFETPETLDGEWANKVIINTIEHQWGSTTTVEDLEAALLDRRSRVKAWKASQKGESAASEA